MSFNPSLASTTVAALAHDFVRFVRPRFRVRPPVWPKLGVHCVPMKDDATISPSATTPARRRPPGAVRRGLIEAGIEMARAGGPDAVVLREAARRVGVAPNAAYRHFADRDALLGAVCVAAMRQMAARMEREVAQVSLRYGTKRGAKARLTAVGLAYLDFATTESGLFETAFAVPRHLEYAADAEAAGPGGRTPIQFLHDTLDELVAAGVLPPERRPDAEYAVWASVHGMAVLINGGPLRQLPQDVTGRLIALLLAFITRGL